MNSNYINYLRAAKKSEGTIVRYCEYIEAMLIYINKPDTEITYMDLVNYQASISDKAADTIRLRIAAIHSYFKFMTKFGLMEFDPSINMEKPKSNSKEKPYMTADDVRAMINCARTARDKAIIMTFASTGIRVSELADIKLADYLKAMNNGTRQIKILGKGAKERTIYINEVAEEYINNYLETRNDNCEYLFASFQLGKINRNNLGLTLKKVAKKAGLPYWEEVSNHVLRAAFATVASNNGIPVAVISKALGHSSLQVTSRYIKNSQENINSAMASMTF